jgi:hypothetical protein
MRRWIQFRLSSLLLAVTLCAIVLATLRRSQTLLEAARRHEIHRSMADGSAQLILSFRHQMPTAAESTSWEPAMSAADQWHSIAAYHERQRDKCRQGIWMPWIMCLPDDPRPTEPLWGSVIR